MRFWLSLLVLLSSGATPAVLRAQTTLSPEEATPAEAATPEPPGNSAIPPVDFRLTPPGTDPTAPAEPSPSPGLSPTPDPETDTRGEPIPQALLPAPGRDDADQPSRRPRPTRRNEDAGSIAVPLVPTNPEERSSNDPGYVQRPTFRDPLANMAVQQAQGNAETLFDGVGGVPRPLDSLYLYPNLNPSGGFRRGDLILNPSLSLGGNYRYTSGDRGGTKRHEAYGLLSPSLDLSLGEPATGRLLSLQYLGGLYLPPTGGSNSVYDQSLAFRAVLGFPKANLGFGVQYAQNYGPNRDFGGQDVGRQIFGLAFTGSYQYSLKTGFESNLTVPIRLFDRGVSTQGLTSTSFLNYAYSPLTTFGLGFSVGAVFPDEGPTQTFEQVLARVTFQGGAKLVFNFTGGLEIRQFGGGDTQLTPAFGLGLTWQAREGTTFVLSADRRIFVSSAVAGTDYVSNSVTLTATQRLGNFMEASGTVGYENADYENVSRTDSYTRSDNYVLVQGRVAARINRRWSASVIASYGNNRSSDQDSVDFVQTLVQLTYVY